jgi:NADH-quinone oxidoreductase subunit N
MPMATLPILTPALPEIFLAVAILFLLLLGVFTKTVNNTQTISYLSIGVMLFTIALLVVLANGRVVTFGGAFITDDFTVFIKILVLVSTAVTILMSKDYLRAHGVERFEFPILVLSASLGMMMMLSANDFLGLYLGIELQSLSLYVLASFQRDNARSTEAGLKYFVLGALSSGIMLYGISMIYGFSGTTDFVTLADIFRNLQGERPSIGIVIGIVFIIAGFSFKVSAVPFHMWTPDVYEGAPTPVTSLFAVAPKLAAMGLFMRVLSGPFGDLGSQWQQIIIFISIASMGLGAFAAINQNNIKRLMAYSSIGHMGYALIGLVVTGGAYNVGIKAGAMQSMVVYLSIYMFMNIGTFAVILLMKRGDRMVENINDLAGLSKTNPVLALVLSIFMFSMAGVPPLAGFIGKLYIFQSAVQAELYALAVIGVLTSVVGAFYYIRIIKVMYFDVSSEVLDVNVNIEMRTVLMVTGIFILFFIIYPVPLIETAEQATAALFQN